MLLWMSPQALGVCMSTIIGRRPATALVAMLAGAASGLLLAATALTTVAHSSPTDDIDGDGFAEAAGDCAPLDPSVGPGATDVPDLAFGDSDCDGVDGDASVAVFVAADGSDGNPGTSVQPVQTLQKAVDLAAVGGDQVYAAVGTYGRVVLPSGHDGVQIYGGYERGTPWTRTSATPTTVLGQPEAVLLDGATDVVLQLVDLQGTRGGGLSAYGIRAINGSEVAVVRSSVSSGQGGQGGQGGSGSTPARAAAGAPGAAPLNCDTSGVGGFATQFGNGTDGGAGGRGGEETNDGENGQAGTKGSGTFGGAGGSGGIDTTGEGFTAGHHGGTGQPGGSGAAGSPGAGGGSDLGAAGAAWAGRSGGDGTNGGAGYGGGGGGGGAGNGAWYAWAAGGGGGQGGDGGSGGTRGFGGGWGGGSFGVYLMNSAVLIDDSSVTSAGGGAGGAGGQGGAGGFGGDGGPGGAARSNCNMQAGNGGAGGPGGRGGAGGNGGGGSGGPSAAVFRGGTSVAAARPGSELVHGTGGAGGGGGGVAGQSDTLLGAGGAGTTDFDADGVTDGSDGCATVARGTADADGDGCPDQPETTIATGPREGAFVLSTSAVLTFTSSEGSSTFACSLDDQAAAACDSGSLALANLSQRTHHLRVWARDGAGDADPSAAERTWTVPRNNTALTHGRGWTKKGGSGYYLMTYSQAQKRGATLSTSVSDARSLALVASRGRGFGTVKVYLGSTLLKKVNLASSKLRKRQLIPVSSFVSPRSGKVRVVVATSGRTVRVEGLGVATQ